MDGDEHQREAGFDVLEYFWVVGCGGVKVVEAFDHLSCEGEELDNVGCEAEGRQGIHRRYFFRAALRFKAQANTRRACFVNDGLIC